MQSVINHKVVVMFGHPGLLDGNHLESRIVLEMFFFFLLLDLILAGPGVREVY